MARNSEQTTLDNHYRQTLVDFLAKTPTVYDATAYYNDHENGTKTFHVNVEYGATCSVKSVDQSQINLRETTGSWSAGETTWILLADGFECSCGEEKNLTLMAHGEVHEVLLRALGVDPHRLLD